MSRAPHDAYQRPRSLGQLLGRRLLDYLAVRDSFLASLLTRSCSRGAAHAET